MTELVALAAGVVIGWLLGRRAGRAPEPVEGGSAPVRLRRPTRQQQKILAMLPPDRPTKTFEELLAAEVEETGVDRISGGAGIPVQVRLKVYHRDRAALGDCEEGRLSFVLAEGTLPADATVETTGLVAE